ncbi:GntR family transcriptional regulator [Actinobacteria bacterium YIM 96077]|uniref:HTH gntR-type domain-containing protein n=1 Tax=Phytoactinopolyspora halophila TaxID=1981511 RepID=A0A329QTT7_9ACTN|nr:GntR family transcriptional regulator [Phytoactinopolyspora halophila]AYY13783.1 GntR family transcriptional regulator [Actinobacteria bacterium YIM 96077]RAW15673.1 hypothetical protein DPM12_08485 [Phytoactinopolyspora halophila]
MARAPESGRATRVDEAESMLRSLIAERRETGGSRLPPEKELSEQLGISRSTLRSALTRLESEGVIARQRRVGTLITSPEGRWERRSALAYPVDMILSLSDYLQAVGADYAVQAVSVRRDPATEEIADALGLERGSPVFTASRLYEVEGRPAAFLEHFLPAVLYGREVHIESLTEGVTTFLRDTEHIRLTHTESTFTAQAASPELAHELAVGEGTPLLVMHAELYSEGPDPVALGRLVFRPDVLCLTASADEGSGEESVRGLRVMSLKDRAATDEEDT